MKKIIFMSMICSLSISWFLTSAQTFTLTHDGISRSYLVHLPSSYDPSTSYPVVMAFNGWYQTPAQIESISRLSTKADQDNFIAVYPKGITPNYQAWNESETAGPDDVGFVSQMLDSLINRYNIDTTKIYATGFSSGAGMCYRLAQQLSNRIAAIAPVAGCIKYSFEPTKKIPIVQFKSKNDNYSSVFPVINYWIEKNNCVSIPDTFFTVTGAIGEIWRSKDSDANIVLYSTESGGHNWPNSANRVDPISATNLMLEFFNNPNPRISALERPENIPTNYLLEQNYPNPFNPVTNIVFSLPVQSVARLEIFNLAGEKVATLLNDTIQSGRHSIKWNGKNNSGQNVSSGTYIYSLTINSGTNIETISKKLLLLK